MAQAVRRFACCVTVKALMPVRILSGRAADRDPVTAMRIPETADAPGKSGAVSRLIAASNLRPGDVNSTNHRSNLTIELNMAQAMRAAGVPANIRGDSEKRNRYRVGQADQESCRKPESIL